MEGRRAIALTGADGFIGRNLALRLRETGHDLRPLNRASSAADWDAAIAGADAVIHLAGVNRPDDPSEFAANVALAERVAVAVETAGRPIPVIVASSAKAGDPGPYGETKLAAEEVMRALAARSGAPVAICRLPNVFGKWSRPNYNSAVATFCHNIARDMPIEIHDPAAPLNLLYVDDLIDGFLALLETGFETGFREIGPVHATSVGAVAELIRTFHADRRAARVAEVGEGLTRALYATYVSFLPVADFAYDLVAHRDPRGAFAEMLRTRDSGQFSYFTAFPGVTRGGHYHHSKTEKFLVVHGEALFRFRHLLTGETHEVRTSGEAPVVVETIPGWTHDITNVGDGLLVSLLWANENFDPERPDTITEKV